MEKWHLGQLLKWNRQFIGDNYGSDDSLHLVTRYPILYFESSRAFGWQMLKANKSRRITPLAVQVIWQVIVRNTFFFNLHLCLKVLWSFIFNICHQKGDFAAYSLKVLHLFMHGKSISLSNALEQHFGIWKIKARLSTELL